jgi:pentatricopeptide repeat protein
MKLFDDMTRLYRIRPNTFTFNSLLNVCVEKRDLDRGMEVLALMRQHQVVPNTSTFNSLASLCAKTGNAAKGLELLATMKTTGVSPDNLTFTSLIAACRARDTEGNDAADTDDSTGDSTAAQATASPPLEQALSLLDRMQREFNVAPDNITLMTLMSVCLRSRRLGYALRAYGQVKAELARNRALQLDKENYYELVNLCAKNGQWRRGLEIVSDMENAGLTPSVRIYNSFLRNFDPTQDVRSTVIVLCCCFCLAHDRTH